MAILGYNKSSAALCVYWKASMDIQWIKSNSCYSILANKSPVCYCNPSNHHQELHVCHAWTTPWSVGSGAKQESTPTPTPWREIKHAFFYDAFIYCSNKAPVCRCQLLFFMPKNTVHMQCISGPSRPNHHIIDVTPCKLLTKSHKPGCGMWGSFH